MPRGPLDILKKVLGMHAQVVTKPSLATSGQVTIMHLCLQCYRGPSYPANTRHSPNVGSMLAYRMRAGPTLGGCLVFICLISI